jgi:putative restriction endonuclease
MGANDRDSGILQWGKYEAERLNVRNGLCLSRLHDAAFDNWLIFFDENLRLLLSPRLKTELSQRTVAENFGVFAGEPLKLPDDAVLPEPKFLSVHRVIFLQQR